jgi:hypothetical protein
MRTVVRVPLVALAALAGGALLSPAGLAFNPLTASLYEKAFEYFAAAACEGAPIPGDGYVIPLCMPPRWFYTAQLALMLLGASVGALVALRATRNGLGRSGRGPPGEARISRVN